MGTGGRPVRGTDREYLENWETVDRIAGSRRSAPGTARPSNRDRLLRRKSLPVSVPGQTVTHADPPALSGGVAQTKGASRPPAESPSTHREPTEKPETYPGNLPRRKPRNQNHQAGAFPGVWNAATFAESKPLRNQRSLPRLDPAGIDQAGESLRRAKATTKAHPLPQGEAKGPPEIGGRTPRTDRGESQRASCKPPLAIGGSWSAARTWLGGATDPKGPGSGGERPKGADYGYG